MNGVSVKTLDFGNSKLEEPNIVLIYCNGILSDFDDIEIQRPKLQEQVEVLLTAFGHRKFTVFNNPTNLDDYLSIVQGRQKKEELIATQFAEFIRKNIKNLSPLQSINVLTHSHGALITKMALELLTLKERDKIEVYSLGGVTMIPKNLAAVVENYVFKGDMISRLGNKSYDSEGILDITLKISQRRLADSISLEEALFDQLFEDWFEEFGSSIDHSESSSNGEVKQITESYFSNFLSNDSLKLKGFEEKFKKYESCLTDYNITLLSRPKDISGLSSNIDNKDFLLMKRKISIIGKNFDDNFHKISAYKEIIFNIAEKIIFKSSRINENDPNSVITNQDYEEYMIYYKAHCLMYEYGGMEMTYDYWKEKVKCKKM